MLERDGSLSSSLRWESLGCGRRLLWNRSGFLRWWHDDLLIGSVQGYLLTRRGFEKSSETREQQSARPLDRSTVNAPPGAEVDGPLGQHTADTTLSAVHRYH